MTPEAEKELQQLGHLPQHQYQQQQQRRLMQDADHEPVQVINNIPELNLRDLRILRPLGRGAKGAVFQVQVRFPSEESCSAALKVVLKSRKKSRRLIEREILSRLHHPLLPTLRGVVETDDIVGYAIDYCPGGDLNSLRRKQSENMFSIEAIRFYGAELVLALEHLHKLGIVYRDLKPENVLIQENGHLMLVDFDLSTKLPPRSSPPTSPSTPTHPQTTPTMTNNSDTRRCKNQHHLPNFLRRRRSSSSSSSNLSSTSNSDSSPRQPKPRSQTPTCSSSSSSSSAKEKSNSFVGTEDYVAPEIISGDGHDYSVDWWCLGVVLYEMLYGTTPFRGANRKETFYRILTKTPDLVGEKTPLRDLIRRLLEKDPKRRVAAEEIKGHEFFKGVEWDQVWRIQRPPYIPAVAEEEEEGEEEVDVEGFVKEVFGGTLGGVNGSGDKIGCVVVEEDKKVNHIINGDVEEIKKNKGAWVDGLVHTAESGNFSVF